MIFWFAGFIALGAELPPPRYCHYSTCRALQAVTVFGAFEWYGPLPRVDFDLVFVTMIRCANSFVLLVGFFSLWLLILLWSILWIIVVRARVRRRPSIMHTLGFEHSSWSGVKSWVVGIFLMFCWSGMSLMVWVIWICVKFPRYPGVFRFSISAFVCFHDDSLCDYWERTFAFIIKLSGFPTLNMA